MFSLAKPNLNVVFLCHTIYLHTKLEPRAAEYQL